MNESAFSEAMKAYDAYWENDVDPDEAMRCALLAYDAAQSEPPPSPWTGPYKDAGAALNGLREAVADMIGQDRLSWPAHCNAPLAIAAIIQQNTLALRAGEARATSLTGALEAMVEAVDGMTPLNRQSEIRALRKAYIEARAVAAIARTIGDRDMTQDHPAKAPEQEFAALVEKPTLSPFEQALETYCRAVRRGMMSEGDPSLTTIEAETAARAALIAQYEAMRVALQGAYTGLIMLMLPAPPNETTRYTQFHFLMAAIERARTALNAPETRG